MRPWDRTSGATAASLLFTAGYLLSLGIPAVIKNGCRAMLYQETTKLRIYPATLHVPTLFAARKLIIPICLLRSLPACLPAYLLRKNCQASKVFAHFPINIPQFSRMCKLLLMFIETFFFSYLRLFANPLCCHRQNRQTLELIR